LIALRSGKGGGGIGSYSGIGEIGIRWFDDWPFDWRHGISMREIVRILNEIPRQLGFIQFHYAFSI